MSSVIKIDGVVVPSPVEWKPGIKDLVTNSTRTGSGKMRFNYVASKRTWDGSWKNLTRIQMTALLATFEGKSFFTIECFDSGANAVITKTFYKGDRPFETPKFLGTEIYQSVTISFIEQ